MTWPRGKELPDLRREDAEVRARVGGGFRPRVSGEDVQHARAELAVLVLLAPDARRQVHQRRERAVRAAPRPHAGELLRIERRALPDDADGRRGVAGFLNGRLQARARGVLLGIVMAEQAPVLHVDRLGQVGGDRRHASAGHVVAPLDDFGNPAPRAGDFAGLA